MVKKLILSLSLVSLIAPVHGMWSGVRQTFGKLSGAAVGCMERAQRVVPTVARIAAPKNSLWAVHPVASKRTVAPSRAQELKSVVDAMYKGYRESNADCVTIEETQRIKKEMSEYCAELSDAQMHEVIDAFHEHHDKDFINDALAGSLDQEIVPWSPSIKHMLAHHEQYAARNDPPEVQELVNELIDYSVEEQKKGNIVFFHGQGWKWQYSEFLNKELSKKADSPIPYEHTSLRFKNASLLDSTDQKSLATRGIRQGDGFDSDRWHGLFVNPGIYSSIRGSNSVDYFRDNYDQSINQERNIQEEKDLFSAFGEQNLFEEIKDSLLFKQLPNLHKNISNYGNLITISMPKELAKEIVYPTTSGGPRITLENKKYSLEDGDALPKEFVCAVDVAKHADKVPFRAECVLVLGENIVNAEKASEYGVTVRSWNSADKKKLALFGEALHYLIHNSDGDEGIEDLELRVSASSYTSSQFLNNLPFLKKCIDKGLLDINNTCCDGSTLLTEALSDVKIISIDTIRQLIDWKADVSKPNMKLQSPLHLAVQHDNIDIVKLLLEHGADANGSIRAAAYYGNRGIVKLLLKHDADVNEGIMGAAANNNLGMVQFLLEHGADANKCIVTAVYVNNLEIVGLLLEHGADANKGILEAIYERNLKMVKLLLEHGADANKGILITSKNSIEMIALLKKYGAKE